MTTLTNKLYGVAAKKDLSLTPNCSLLVKEKREEWEEVKDPSLETSQKRLWFIFFHKCN